MEWLRYSTGTDMSKRQSRGEIVNRGAHGAVLSGTGKQWPTVRRQVLISISPNAEVVSLIFNSKRLGMLKTSTQGTVLCHFDFVVKAKTLGAA